MVQVLYRLYRKAVVVPIITSESMFGCSLTRFLVPLMKKLRPQISTGMVKISWISAKFKGL